MFYIVEVADGHTADFEKSIVNDLGVMLVWAVAYPEWYAVARTDPNANPASDLFIP